MFLLRIPPLSYYIKYNFVPTLIIFNTYKGENKEQYPITFSP